MDFSFQDMIHDLHEPKKIFDNLEFIDRGTFGAVYKAKCKENGKVYSVKILSEGGVGGRLFIESQIQKLCSNCEYINRYYGSYYSLRANEIWLVLDYCKYGSLGYLLKDFKCSNSPKKTFSESEISVMIKMLLKGIDYLHTKVGYLHRDIKAQNILLNDEGIVQLCDFGVCTAINEKGEADDIDHNREYKMSEKCGSDCWICPEALMEDMYTTACDVWSVGVTCIELAEGAPPNSDLKLNEIFENILCEKVFFKNEKKFSKTFVDFVKRCLTTNYRKRPSCQELLKDKFITQYDEEQGKKIMKDLIKEIENNKDLNKMRMARSIRESIVVADNYEKKAKESTSIKKSMFIGVEDALASGNARNEDSGMVSGTVLINNPGEMTGTVVVNNPAEMTGTVVINDQSQMTGTVVINDPSEITGTFVMK